MTQTIETIGIANGGGDCPGLNAVIRGAVRGAILGHGWRVIGINDGFDGLIWTDRTMPLAVESIAACSSAEARFSAPPIAGTRFRYIIEEKRKKRMERTISR